MKVHYKLCNQELVNKNMVDVMHVNGKLRWADAQGNQNNNNVDQVLGFRSNDSCEVVVRLEAGGTASFPLVNFASTKEGKVYLSGPDTVERVDGTLARIRKQAL